jgi:hypothetical protein
MTFKQLEKSNWIQKDFYNVEEQLKHYIYRCSEKAFEKGDSSRDSIHDAESFEKYRANMREKFIEAIGGLPSGNSPLNARSTGFVKGDGFQIEKVIYESRAGTYVTSNLYLPDNISSARGAVIFVCGHMHNAKTEPEYQIVCQYLVHAGLVVLAQDPIGQGERFSYFEKSLGRTVESPGSGEHDYAGLMCLPLGYAMSRYTVHDIMRSVDYLCTRPEVDPSRIGITGNSMGGLRLPWP